jgi:hypothetical protein
MFNYRTYICFSGSNCFNQWRSQNFEVGDIMASAKCEPVYGGQGQLEPPVRGVQDKLAYILFSKLHQSKYGVRTK